MNLRCFKYVLKFTLFISISAFSKDYFLSVGGGYSPNGSQSVLELNIKNFANYLKNKNSNYSLTQLYGAGKNPKLLDVYTKMNVLKLEDDLFLTFFDGNSDADCVWRHNEVEGLDDSSSRENLEYFLEQHSEEVSEKDQFRFYFTGHGGQTEDDDKEESRLDLWGSDVHLNSSEFTKHLDKFDPKAQVQVLMVQCFSGGFANMNYEDANIEGKLSSHNRCGFYSQLPDRLAAGCTPDLAKREEYSRYFMEAYKGVTENGKAVSADYNKDGVIGADEAHAYVLKNENSIDVPISTSSWLLRQAKLKVAFKNKALSLKELKSSMSVVEKSVLKSLIRKTGIIVLPDSKIYNLTETEIKKEKLLYEQAKKAEKETQEYLDTIYSEIKFYLKERFPIFYSSYGVTHGSKLVLDAETAQQAKEVMKKHAKYSLFKKAFLARNAASDVTEQWEKRVVQLERLHYLLETKLLEKALDKSTDELKDRYKELQTCESASYF